MVLPLCVEPGELPSTNVRAVHALASIRLLMRSYWLGAGEGSGGVDVRVAYGAGPTLGATDDGLANGRRMPAPAALSSGDALARQRLRDRSHALDAA
jgi:hypothetical protein